jgi:hypothetical protein
MFYRAASKKTGAGLGLYIVKEVLTKLGGNVNVKSIQGQETVFTVNIPQHRQELVPTEVQKSISD